MPGYRHRNGPGLGLFLLVGLAAFLLVFALQPGSGGRAWDRIQSLGSRVADLAWGAPAGFGSWRAPSPPRPAPAAARSSQNPVPRPAERVYRVERGETLSGIAARHGVDLAALIRRNGIRDPHRIREGQVLVLPGADVAAASAAPAAQTPGAVSSGPPASLAALDDLLAMAEEELAGARFEQALHTALAVERVLASSRAAPGVAERRARMEVVRATAYAALGHPQQVQRALHRALAADPDLQLDRATTSPKLIEALEAARRRLRDAERARASEIALRPRPGDESGAAHD